MNCKPKPTVTCGSTNFDTCIVYTGPKFCFLNQDDDCFRQNEFNEAAGTLLCDLSGRVEAIEDNIDLTDLSGCDAVPAQNTVKEAIQELYTAVCSIKVDLNLPVTGLTIPACIKDPCDNTPTTLGTLLQGILDQLTVCCPDCSGT